MWYSFKDEISKMASSSIHIAAGKKNPLDDPEHLTPSIGYHYVAHGKYLAPSVNFSRGDMKSIKLKRVKKLDIDQETALLENRGNGYHEGVSYIPPKSVDSYIKAYDKSSRERINKYLQESPPSLSRASSTYTVKKVGEDPSIMRKLLGFKPKNRFKRVYNAGNLENPEVRAKAEKVIEDDLKLRKNIMKEHENVLKYMNKHKDIGFSVGVG